MTFGEKVRSLRKARHLSQADLAKALDISTRSVQSYESGRNRPRHMETYAKLAKVLACDRNYLLVEEPSDEDTAAFIAEAGERYGGRGAAQARQLLSEVSGLFAGGDMAEEDKDEFMRAVQDAYWIAKKRNRKFAQEEDQKA